MPSPRVLAFLLLISGSCLADARGEETKPRKPPYPKNVPLETSPPNVPAFKPAFAGQTRAPGVQTRTPIQITKVTNHIDHPWGLAFLPDRRILVASRVGKLFIVTQAGEKSRPVAGLPRVDARNQGGLLDVRTDPDFRRTQLIYWSYYEPREGGNGLAVARARLVAGQAPRIEGLQIIFRMEPTIESTAHAGGRLVFDSDGKLFVTLGERLVPEGRKQARDLSSDFGKIIRIYPDGSIPTDNPYVDRKGARPEIWTSGHRNIIAAAMDQGQRLWVVEMGPRGGDELNLIKEGADYGWPTIGYGEEYTGEPIHAHTQAPGLEQPVYYWDPVISPGGLVIYSGRLFPEWKGNFLIGGLTSKALVRLVLENDHVVAEERLLSDLDARIRTVVQDPDGAVYVTTDEDDGQVLKLTPGR